MLENGKVQTLITEISHFVKYENTQSILSNSQTVYFKYLSAKHSQNLRKKILTINTAISFPTREIKQYKVYTNQTSERLK